MRGKQVRGERVPKTQRGGVFGRRNAKRTRGSSRGGSRSVIGRDMARVNHSARRFSLHWLPAVFVGGFLATLALTVLREQLIEVRYAVIASVDEEARLREERDRWVSQVQELRNPARLSALADQQGLARPDHTIDLRTFRDRSSVVDLFAELGSSRGVSP